MGNSRTGSVGGQNQTILGLKLSYNNNRFIWIVGQNQTILGLKC